MTGYGPPEVLKWAQVPLPEPDEGQILPWRKVSTLRDLAARMSDGSLNTDVLSDLSDEVLMTELPGSPSTLPAAHLLRRPVNGPHASNVCRERPERLISRPATRSPAPIMACPASGNSRCIECQP
jgi:hypothetical protein